jgi:cytochrome c6
VRVPAKPDTSPSGEALFKQYCSSCHPNGGNVSDPGRALYGSALRRNHITKPEDIVRIIRNPLSRMIRLDVSTLSDQDARVIAEYILATFK